MTKLEDDDDYQPLYIREYSGWTDQEAKDFIKEVERLKELWYSDVVNDPQVSTRQALANLRNIKYLEIKRESEERHKENERLNQEHLHRIKEENKNLNWPKPAERLKIRKPFDYWKDGGCLYCRYKPKTTHDYEVHIVTIHTGKPAYPGPADVELYDLHLPDPDGSDD